MSYEGKRLVSMAKRIPPGIRKHILQEGFIDKAKDVHLENTPQEYLHDVYSEFLDPAREFGDFGCARCRQHVLAEFQKLKPVLEQLENSSN